MGRPPCCKKGVKKGPWTPEEDKKLVEYIEKEGQGSWAALPKLAGLNRCGKSCRLRWTNYLRPDIKRGNFSNEEDRLIIHLHSLMGNKWAAIAANLPGRTDNEIKNYWNTHLRKQLMRQGIDPVTHLPRADLSLIASFSSINLELVLRGLIQGLLTPSYPNNFHFQSLLQNDGELESTVQHQNNEVPQFTVNPESGFSAASENWKYSSDENCENDYCWEDILA